MGESDAEVMFLALFVLYSPRPPLPRTSSWSSRSMRNSDQAVSQCGRDRRGLLRDRRGLLMDGEPLLHVLGLTTAALAAAGGTALILASVPMILGTRRAANNNTAEVAQGPDAWQSIVFMPVTFPLTIGGATVGLIIGIRAESQGLADLALPTGAALLYAAVTGLSMYIASRIEPASLTGGGSYLSA